MIALMQHLWPDVIRPFCIITLLHFSSSFFLINYWGLATIIFLVIHYFQYLFLYFTFRYWAYLELLTFALLAFFFNTLKVPAADDKCFWYPHCCTSRGCDQSDCPTSGYCRTCDLTIHSYNHLFKLYTLILPLAAVKVLIFWNMPAAQRWYSRNRYISWTSWALAFGLLIYLWWQRETGIWYIGDSANMYSIFMQMFVVLYVWPPGLLFLT